MKTISSKNRTNSLTMSHRSHLTRATRPAPIMTDHFATRRKISTTSSRPQPRQPTNLHTSSTFNTTTLYSQRPRVCALFKQSFASVPKFPANSLAMQNNLQNNNNNNIHRSLKRNNTTLLTHYTSYGKHNTKQFSFMKSHQTLFPSKKALATVGSRQLQNNNNRFTTTLIQSSFKTLSYATPLVLSPFSTYALFDATHHHQLSTVLPFQSVRGGIRNFSEEKSAEELFSQVQEQAQSLDSAQSEKSIWDYKPPRGPQGPRKRQSDEAWCRVQKIPTSVKKFTPVLKMIRGMTYYKARIQMQLSIKGTAPYVLRALDSARANAENNHGLDVDRLYVSEAFCTRGPFRSGIRFHGRGRAGMARHPSCHLLLILKQWKEGLTKPPLIGGRGYRLRRAERIAHAEQARLRNALKKIQEEQENPRAPPVLRELVLPKTL